jgi:hypothetical protein
MYELTYYGVTITIHSYESACIFAKSGFTVKVKSW